MGWAALLAAAVFPGAAGSQESAACASLSRLEAESRAQLDRRIATVDEAAGRGDIERFCAAGADLMFLYGTMSGAAQGCSAERAAKWVKAEADTAQAVAKVCP